MGDALPGRARHRCCREKHNQAAAMKSTVMPSAMKRRVRYGEARHKHCPAELGRSSDQLARLSRGTELRSYAMRCGSRALTALECEAKAQFNR